MAILTFLVAIAALAAQDAHKDLPADRSRGEIESVAEFTGPMLTGVTFSREGRIFVNFPRWGDDVDFTVAEVRDGKAVPYPDAEINRPDMSNPSKSLISVQSVVVDPDDRLWMLDTASPEFKPTPEGGPKLVGVNLKDNSVFKTIVFPRDVALPTTYLNDVRFDLRHGEGGFAYITDSSVNGPNAIIVVDLASGDSWRKLHEHPSVKPDPAFLPFVEGRAVLQDKPGEEPKKWQVGSDGIAISADGSRLYYCPLSSRHLYSVGTEALRDRSMAAADAAKTVHDHGEKGASDGMESDADGRIYFTEYEANAIVRGEPGKAETYETIAHDPRMLWPDTLAVGHDGYLYFTANQLHRQPNFHDGKDLREKPYSVFRVKIAAKPVLLK